MTYIFFNFFPVPGPCKKGTISFSLPLDREAFSQDDINTLIEMHPPTCMPNGNVGTKTSHFLQEINACRLPPKIISKLGLQFPRNRARRIYGNVPFDYKNRKTKISDFKNVHSRGIWLQKSQYDTTSFEEKDEVSNPILYLFNSCKLY